MENLTLDHVKTIAQSILASATRYKPNLNVTDPDDPRYVVGSDKVASKSDVTKMGKRLTTLEQYEDETYNLARNANSTANSARSTANSAQTTANDAKSSASTAQSTANTAKTTAENAKTTAESALPKSGGTLTGWVYFGGKDSAGRDNASLSSTGEIEAKEIKLIADQNAMGATIRFVPNKNAETKCYVGRDSESDAFAPSTLRFIANGSPTMILKGMNILRMRSANESFFDICIDDNGQLLINDAAGKEIKQNAMMTLTAPGGGKYRLTVDDEGNLSTEEVTT